MPSSKWASLSRTIFSWNLSTMLHRRVCHPPSDESINRRSTVNGWPWGMSESVSLSGEYRTWSGSTQTQDRARVLLGGQGARPIELTLNEAGRQHQSLPVATTPAPICIWRRTYSTQRNHRAYSQILELEKGRQRSMSRSLKICFKPPLRSQSDSHV